MEYTMITHPAIKSVRDIEFKMTSYEWWLLTQDIFEEGKIPDKWLNTIARLRNLGRTLASDHDNL